MEIVPLSFDDLDPTSLEGVEIRKHNDLIEAKYQIPSIREQQIILMLLAQIQPNDESFKGYRIAISDFSRVLGVNSKSIYEEIENAVVSLASRTIKIKQGKSFLVASWLSSAEYRHGTGYVELCFDPKLKPYLLQLKGHFTRYDLDKVLHFKSTYAIRLYELLKKEAQIVEKYQNKKHFEKEFSYIELREAFGIGKNEYKLFADFRRKTIEPAVTEIYDKTELNITDVKYGKTGRAVSKITFVVDIRSKAEGDVRAVQMQIEEPKDNKKETIKQRLVELGYSIESASRDLNKHGIQLIERSIAYTLAKQQEAQTAGKPFDFPRYLSKTIENDWGGAWEQAVIDGKSKAEKVKQEAKEREEREEKERARNKARAKELLNDFYALPDEEREIIGKQFTEQEKDIFYIQLFKDQMESGEIKDQVLRSKFAVFLMTRGI